MTNKRGAVACPREPIGLNHDEAAAYIGYSPSTFDRMMRDGVMPCPREYRGRMSWDADELIAAYRRLPRKNVDLLPGVAPMHDEQIADGPFDDFRA